MLPQNVQPSVGARFAPGQVALEQAAFIRKVYAYMAGGLLATAVTATAVASPTVVPVGLGPPRDAQWRSEWWDASQSSRRPCASTMRTRATLSEVVPNCREANPTPPPRASPAIPTVGQEPAGIVMP